MLWCYGGIGKGAKKVGKGGDDSTPLPVDGLPSLQQSLSLSIPLLSGSSMFIMVKRSMLVRMITPSQWMMMVMVIILAFDMIHSFQNDGKQYLNWKQARKLQAMLVRNYYRLTHCLTGVKCRATSVAKKAKLFWMLKKPTPLTHAPHIQICILENFPAQNDQWYVILFT